MVTQAQGKCAYLECVQDLIHAMRPQSLKPYTLTVGIPEIRALNPQLDRYFDRQTRNPKP